jgi:hypothetical protein
VVLVVIGHERQPVVAVLDASFEHAGVPVDHLGVSMGVVDDVGELRG